MSQALNLKQQKEYLLSKIGNPVKFKYPEGEFSKDPRTGKLKDRVVALDSDGEDVVYWNVFDLIEFEGYPEDWLRLTYYRYKKKEMKWVFAGQTSLSNPISGLVELFSEAAKEKQWAKLFFTQVIK